MAIRDEEWKIVANKKVGKAKPKPKNIGFNPVWKSIWFIWNSKAGYPLMKGKVLSVKWEQYEVEASKYKWRSFTWMVDKKKIKYEK